MIGWPPPAVAAPTGRMNDGRITNGPAVLTVRAVQFSTALLRLPCLAQTLYCAQLRNRLGQFHLCLGQIDVCSVIG
jgi:hypothetical protein